MRKFFAMLLALAMLLTLTACKKKEAETPDTPTQTQTPAAKPVPDAPPELKPVEDVVVSPREAEGRVPGGEYVLPEEITSMMDWQWQGAVGLLAQEEDVAFYALEGKESCPALLRWGEAMAEFDWWYSTPQAVEPELWLMDIDGDGETEVVADCYGASGTGVSMEYIYIVEKEADGQLVSYELPWKDVCYLVNKQLQAVDPEGTLCAALGDQLVDISGLLARESAKGVDICLGQVARYTPTEEGLAFSFGVVAEGDGIPRLSLYVAKVEGSIRYENETFVLEDLRLVKI